MDWLTGYKYRKQITINHTDDGAQTNYQMPLTIVKAAGADSGPTVYLGNHALNWPNDIRFTASDGTTLLGTNGGGWREESDLTDGTWWVKVDTIPAHPDDGLIYLYYGKASDTDASSIANTFIVGDDFERGANGDAIGGSWTIAADDVDISTEQKWGGTRAAKWIGGTSIPQTIIPVLSSANIAIRFRYYKETATRITFVHGDGTNRYACHFETTEAVTVYDGAAYVDTTLDCLADSWGLCEINNFNWGATTVTMVVDGVTKTGIDISYAAGGGNLFQVFGYTANNDLWIDDFIVRNWTANEPSFGAWGTEIIASTSRGFLIG